MIPAQSSPLHATIGGFGVRFSPQDPSLLAVAASQYFGVSGYGIAYFFSQHGAAQQPSTPAAALRLRGMIACPDGCHDVAFSAINPQVCIAATGDGVKVLQVPIVGIEGSGRILHTYDGHNGTVYGVQWDPFIQDRFVSTSEDCTLRSGSVDTRNPFATILVGNHQKEVYEASWSTKRPHTLLSCAGDGMWRLWDLRVTSNNTLSGLSSQLVGCPTTGTSTITPGRPGLAAAPPMLTCDWSHHNEFNFVTAGVDQQIAVWDLRRPQHPSRRLTFPGESAAIRRVRFSPHSPTLLLSGGYDFRVCVWELTSEIEHSQELRQIYEHHREFVVGVDWSPHHPGTVASTSWDGTACVWPLGAQPRIIRPTQHNPHLPPIPQPIPGRVTPKRPLKEQSAPSQFAFRKQPPGIPPPPPPIRPSNSSSTV